MGTEEERMEDEKQLIDDCKAGKVKAQRALYNLFARKMMAVCLRYSDNFESAQDLLQEGFIKVFSAIGTYNFAGSFEGWMRRIFVNTALEELRRKNVLKNSIEIDTPVMQAEADYSAVDQISANELLELISALPVGFRTVFNMFAIEGYSHKEIADVLGITESTSRSQYTRAKKALQEKLKELL